MVAQKRENDFLKEKCVGCPCLDSNGGCLKKFMRGKANIGIGDVPHLKNFSKLKSSPDLCDEEKDEGLWLSTHG